MAIVMAAEERYLRLKSHKVLILVLKVIPMLLALCALLNTIFSYYGIRCESLSLAGGISLLPLLFLYLASYAFCFCEYHRMFLHYVVVNNVINLLDYYVGIPVGTRTFFGLHLVLICVFLFLILHLYRKERCCKL